LRVVKSHSHFVKVESQVEICRDVDDNKFLELAIDSSTVFLITGDRDLLSLKAQIEYQEIIVTPRDFLEMMAMRGIATAGKQSPRLGDFAIASFHFVPFAMTDLNETVFRYSALRCILELL